MPVASRRYQLVAYADQAAKERKRLRRRERLATERKASADGSRPGTDTGGHA